MTIYRDPRAMQRDRTGTFVVLFSHPDQGEVKEWAKENKIPTSGWVEDRKELRVRGARFIGLALKIPKASKKTWEAYKEARDGSPDAHQLG